MHPSLQPCRWHECLAQQQLLLYAQGFNQVRHSILMCGTYCREHCSLVDVWYQAISVLVQCCGLTLHCFEMSMYGVWELVSRGSL